MVSLGVDEPLQETEYGMVNPYRTGLSQFLAHEEAKEKEKKEAEQAREMERRAEAIKDGQSPKAEDLAASSTTETEGTELQPIGKDKQEEFKFTIDADEDDEELQKIEVEDKEASESTEIDKEQPLKEEEPVQEVV